MISILFVAFLQQSTKNYPPAAQKFMKQHPNSKMNEGMEALRQIATTSLFLQNEKANDTNNQKRVVPTIREPKMDSGTIFVVFQINQNLIFAFFCIFLDEPFEMKKIEDEIEICNISDGEDDNALVKLSKYDIKPNEPSTSLRINGINPTMMPSTSSTATTSKSTSIPLHQQQQQKSNKLSRSRAPINQQKPKDSDLMETSLMILDASPLKPTAVHQPSTSPKATSAQSGSKAQATTTISLGNSSSIAASSSSTSYPYSNNHAIPSTSGLQQYYRSPQSIMADTHPFGGIIEPMKPFIQDGSTNLTLVQPATTAAHSSSSFEPELVLSPAKLGQQ